MPKHITQAQKQTIVEFYKTKPMTLENVCKQFNIGQPTVSKILREYGIKPYNKNRLFSPELDENFFHTINCEEKAYFLGLIITDGCIHSSKGRQPLVALTLQEKDKYILDSFKECIKSNKTVTSDGRGRYGINILSKKMVNDLRQYGIVERKSLSTKFPHNLRDDMYPHLVRGILDGDGLVSFYAQQGKKSHIKAIRFYQGSKQFLEDLMDCLYEKCGVDFVSIYQEKDNLWSIAYRKNNNLLKLIEYLYHDAHFYMKRKKYLCDKICDEIKG